MISNQILTSTIEGLKEIGGIDLRVFDPEGNEVASTTDKPLEAESALRQFVSSSETTSEADGIHFFKVMDERQPEYILAVSGGGANAGVLGDMAAFQLQGLLTAYREHFDRDNFIKNLLLDNLLQVDIYNRAKKLQIRSDEKRVAMIVVCKGRHTGVREMIRNSGVTDPEDFVTEVDADNIVIVKHLPDDVEPQVISDTAGSIASALETGGVTGVHVSYGTVVGELREVSRSYKEAKMALEVGRIFSGDSRVISYAELGIGRLIYQLPIPLCKMFIKEIFDAKKPDTFDDETMQTIEKFFENNLNVSETSRQLFIHRNTLVYRLDKLQKTTGLDLRVFEDAITFKIAMMVVKYMNHMEKAEFS